MDDLSGAWGLSSCVMVLGGVFSGGYTNGTFRKTCSDPPPERGRSKTQTHASRGRFPDQGVACSPSTPIASKQARQTEREFQCAAWTVNMT